MPRRTALIAGASGLIGRRVAERLTMSDDWEVMGLARTARASDGMRWIAVDLTDARDCARKLADLNSVTHLIYAARYDHPHVHPAEDEHHDYHDSDHHDEHGEHHDEHGEHHEPGASDDQGKPPA